MVRTVLLSSAHCFAASAVCDSGICNSANACPHKHSALYPQAPELVDVDPCSVAVQALQQQYPDWKVWCPRQSQTSLNEYVVAL